MNKHKIEHDHFYYIKDLLGNIRETYVYPWEGYKECVQRTQYYPSGLPWVEAMMPSEQPWKYNGKEFVEMHGLDEYDSKARWYYPAICRTTTMDPLAEKYYATSPYAWCGNNPVRNVDFDGREWYEAEDGNIIWDDNIVSQEAMNQAGIKGVYLGNNVLVGTHDRDENLNESINGAIFELYLETNKSGAVASIKGNTIPYDVNNYGTLQEGRYPAKYQSYKGKPAILINEGKNLSTVKGNPNNKENYNADGSIKPIEEHVMDEIFFHYGNNFFNSLVDSKGKPWTTGCQTGGNYKGAWDDYMSFMQHVPTTFNGWYYLRAKK